MMDNKKLNDYLTQLENCIKDISPSDRAQILVDIEKHIQDSLEKYPDKNLGEVLNDLGQPQKVANHYRLDRGLKTFKPKRHPIAKMFFISITTIFVAFLVFILIAFWKFTPVFKIDEKNDRIIILGGLIDINGKSGKVKLMDQYQFIGDNFSNQFEGSIDFPIKEYSELLIDFNSGVLDLTTSTDNKLSWNCKLEVPPNDDFLNYGRDTIKMDLKDFQGINCQLKIPQNIELTIEGKDARVRLDNPEYDSMVELNNGQVIIIPNPEIDYKYNLTVDKGAIDEFESSNNKNAFEVNVEVENGSINNN